MSLNRIIQAYYIKKTVLLLEQLSVVQNREVVIWGTGNFGKFALELLNIFVSWKNYWRNNSL